MVMEALSPRMRDTLGRIGTCEAFRYKVADLKLMIARLLSAAVPLTSSVGLVAPVPALIYERGRVLGSPGCRHRIADAEIAAAAVVSRCDHCSAQ